MRCSSLYPDPPPAYSSYLAKLMKGELVDKNNDKKMTVKQGEDKLKKV